MQDVHASLGAVDRFGQRLHYVLVRNQLRGDDFGQLGGGTRWIALLLILALGAGIVWVTMEMVR